jgi:hypothetical protein
MFGVWIEDNESDEEEEDEDESGSDYKDWINGCNTNLEYF